MLIGQTRPKLLGKLCIQAGKNVLLTGPSGHGKTTLAQELKTLTYYNLLSPEVPTSLLKVTLNSPYVSVICDEIHSSKSQDAWAIFLDTFQGVVIFTTTNPEKVIPAIKTRSQIIELTPYTEEELAEISGLQGRNAIAISKICRGIPRKASNLSDIFKVFGGTMKQFVLEVLEMSPYMGEFLFPEEILYLKTLALSQPTAERTLKGMVNLGNFDEIELGLRRLGLVQITPRGRILNGQKE